MTTLSDKDNDGSIKLAVGQIMSDVRHIGSNIALLRADAKEHRDEVKGALEQHSDRITRVEQFMWKVIGITALIAVIVPLGVTVALGVL